MSSAEATGISSADISPEATDCSAGLEGLEAVPAASARSAVRSSSPGSHNRSMKAATSSMSAGRPAAASRARRSARQLSKRSSRFLASARRITASSAGGTSRLISRSGVEWQSRIARQIIMSLTPVNGRRPARTRYITTPKANWSIRASTGWPEMYSGAMYANLPLTIPVRVVDSGAAAVMALAMPKSTSLVWPARDTRMFSIEMSRWIRPRWRPSRSHRRWA